MSEPTNGTAREIAKLIFDELQAIPRDPCGDSHRSRRARLKKKRLAELPREQLFGVKAILENMLQVRRTGNNAAWGEQNSYFFRRRGNGD